MPQFMKLHEVCLLSEEGNTSRTQIFKKGTFDHPWYGLLEFDDEVFDTFIKNFNDNVRGIDIQANYGHASYDEAAGWIKEIVAEGDKLFANIEWTDEAAAKIRAKKWKYISPEFDLAYKDNETGEVYGATIVGVALTNIPFLKGMDQVSSKLNELNDEQITRFMELAKSEKDKTMKLEELLEALKNLSEGDKAKVAAALDTSAAQTDGDKALAEENATLKAKIEKQEREMKFGELLANEKVVPAQKDAYLAGDMAKFAELAVKINLDEAGSEETPSDDDVSDATDSDEGKSDEEITAKNADEAQDKVNELAEKLVNEKKLSYPDAVRTVLRTHTKLAEIYKAA